MIILRLKYKKEKNMKFLSHLELIKTMERVFRRMQLPMAFSKGFSPKPKINYAAPLPVGVSSECEYLDVELLEKIDLDEMLKGQEAFMPRGLTLVEGKYFSKTKSLMSMVTDSAYLVEITSMSHPTKAEVEGWIQTFLQAKTISYQKANKKNVMKTIDVKPWIQEMIVLAVQDQKIMFRVLLTTGSNGNLKPEKLMEMFVEGLDLDLADVQAQYHRISLHARDQHNKLIHMFEV